MFLPPIYCLEFSYSNKTLTRVTDFGDGSTVTNSVGKIASVFCLSKLKLKLNICQGPNKSITKTCVRGKLNDNHPR